MKEEEEDYLFFEKTVADKKTIEQAKKEIKRLKDSQVTFKENKLEIKLLKNKLIKLTKENDELKNKLFKVTLRINNSNEDKVNNMKENSKGEIKYLKRIINILKQEEEPMAQGMIPKICNATNVEIYPCLGFLEKNRLIKSIKENGKIKYFIE